jgi:Xaa-Pro dipeptidase
MSNNYNRHIAQIQERYEQSLNDSGVIDGILIHSGVEHFYHADDQSPPFRAYGHFCHWMPIDRPDQLLLIMPGQRPRYFQVIPPDYWYDQSIDNEDWWTSAFDIISLTAAGQISQHLGTVRGLAFLGEAEDFARSLGIAPDMINPPDMLNQLDYQRAYKTDYEIQQLRDANRAALRGHAAARDSFLQGGSEYAIHMAYLQACRITDQDCPYTSIVAVNEKAAILHYQHKRRHLPDDQKGQVLLIDAGYRLNNYCSDITRTTVAQDVHGTFRLLLEGMQQVQQQLVSEVHPGLSCIDLHLSAMRQVAQLAVDLDLIRCGLEEAMALQLPQLFMPHGVGHLLGVQVHDVGGHLRDWRGSLLAPPDEFPFLRNTRTMAEDMVFTVEPGFYFIDQLLDPVRATAEGKNLNWPLLDQLIRLGGVRIEDNVRVTASGVENLTRQ